MKLDEARRILSDHHYVVTLCEKAIEKMSKDALDNSPTLELLQEQRGIVKGIRIVENFYTQAEATVKNATRDAEAERVEPEHVAPPAAVGALLEPMKPAETSNN